VKLEENDAKLELAVVPAPAPAVKKEETEGAHCHVAAT